MASRNTMYRGWVFSQLQDALTVYRHMVKSVDRPRTNTLRDGGTGWTIVEVICHLRDFDMIFLERAERTLRETHPELTFPDPDRLARERNYNALAPDVALGQWEAARRRMMNVFQNIDEDNEETWSRTGAHPNRGPFTLNDQLLLIPRHDMLHLAQITKILQEN